MEIHFINVGCGDMTLLLMPNGTTFLIDCNITNDNSKDVMSYFTKVMGDRNQIEVFVNTHRDADHMRGLEIVHQSFPIQKIWDSGVPGTTTDSDEYKTYMRLRRTIGFNEVSARKYWTYDEVIIRVMNSKWEDYSDANSQSIVVKAEYKGNSVIITGDTDYRPWKEKIVPYYGDDTLKCTFLQAAHHGSITFFDDPSDEKNYYTGHIAKLKPAMTIVSVGSNSYGLPDDNSMKLYEEYSSGSSKNNKVYTTQDKGNLRLTFKEDGGWTLNCNQ